MKFYVTYNTDKTTLYVFHKCKISRYTLDNEFIECIKDINEIDPISIIKEELLQQLKLGEKI
jgi:hypothetical protein